jgi:phosphatidylserine/phosphatidylglycerophosphate/cardiolipin synthase-like enzyme
MKHPPLLVTENDYLDVLMGLLDHARESVDILAFSFAMASAGGRIDFKGAPFQVAQKIKEIKKKRGRKLKIRLYIEGVRETSLRNRVTAAHLAKAGVKVVYGSTHAKGFCVDGRYLLIGSTNLTNQSIRKNNETNVLVDDRAAAAEFLKYFGHLWEGGGHGGIELQPPMVADGAFKDELIAMIDSAKKRLEFSIYFFDQRDIEKAFVRAHERGVKITGFINDHRAFALSYVHRTHRTVGRLREAGLDDLHFAPDNIFTHSKYLIKDRKEVAMGTGNWLNEDVKIHPQLYIHLHDAQLARRLAKHLAGQIDTQASG